MAWTTNPYATVAQVKSALDLQSTKDDAWIQELIGEAQSAIDRYVGYPFQTDGTSQNPATRTYDGNDDTQLYIDYCISISQVQELNFNLVWSGTGILFLNTIQTLDITADIVLGPPNTSPGYVVRRRSGLPFMIGTQNYTFSGVFGVPEIPYEITRACIRLVVHYYKMRDTNYSDVMVEQGGIRQKYNKPIPEDVVEMLLHYKRRLFLAW